MMVQFFCPPPLPDHADPVVQHDAESDTAELLEYEVVENILDGRPTKGITWPELLECTIRLLDLSLDGKLEEEISNWEPEASPMPEPDLGSGHMKRMLCSGPSEQSVPDSDLVARVVKDAAEENLNHKPVMNPVQDNDPDGQLREVKEYENQSYVEKTGETQFSYDTGLSDQELEDGLNHKPVMNPVQDNDPDSSTRGGEGI